MRQMIYRSSKPCTFREPGIYNFINNSLTNNKLLLLKNNKINFINK